MTRPYLSLICPECGRIGGQRGCFTPEGFLYHLKQVHDIELESIEPEEHYDWEDEPDYYKADLEIEITDSISIWV